MFSSLTEIKMSQKRDGVGRQVSLDDPSPFSSYLTDQVFLQASKPLRRHPTSSVLKRDAASQPPQGESCLPWRKPAAGFKGITMSNHGDDCYFFYYSTCTKGDSCPFRHCEAAMGNETVCNLWQEGRCFRTVCKFRHMEITKNRKEIPCYWENQAAGCQKPHCAFFHEKPRYVDGMFVPPDKTQGKNMEQPHDEPAPPPAAPAATIPQLRGVIKTEAQEPVPSPTHPPVVINPADDDEDEDEEGEVGPSPRKLTRSDNSLNFGVSTLEEIRLRKALKASMKRAGYPIQNADASTNREKENIQSIFRPVLYEAGDETGRPSGSVTERLGKKMPNTDVTSREAVPLKRSLAERLGRVADEEEPLLLPQKALKPIKERLGLSAGSGATQPAESNTESKKAPEQIRIKTLEEIRQEKAAKTCSLSRDGPQVEAPQINNSKSIKGVKRTITVKDQAVSHVKTFSEILHAKKKRQEEEKAKYAAEEAPGKSQGECDTAGPDSEALNLGDVRVKTLDEIRREKAARIQAQQVLEAENSMNCDAEENCAKKPRLLRIKKSTSQSTITAETTVDVTERPLKPHAAPETSVANGNSVKVKTFEEIMREKHLRKQEMEERAQSSAEAEPCQKQAAERTLKRKVPLSLTPPRASSPSSTTLAPGTILSTQHVPVRKLIPLKSKAASPLNSSTAPCTRGAAVTSGLVKQNSSPDSHSKSPSGLRESPEKNMNSGRTPLPTQQARAGPQGPTAQAPSDDKTLNNNQKEYTTDAKVRPKLNVKPSVMKPAVHMKPGQKRRGTNRSAVAAVKPLNSASTALEERLQEMTDRQVFPSPSAETQLSSSVPCSPSTLLDSGSSSSPLREELQTVPVFKQSQETKMSLSVAAREACTVPQSPILKTPTQPKSRRISVAASRSTSSAAASTSAVDDFEELISEFTSDHLVHEDVDPDIGEDDLLQELSEMIDS